MDARDRDGIGLCRDEQRHEGDGSGFGLTRRRLPLSVIYRAPFGPRSHRFTPHSLVRL